MKQAMTLEDFEYAIWSNSGTYGEVVGVVGYCIILTQDKKQLPESLGTKYRKFILVMSDGRTLDTVVFNSLQDFYEGNVIRWAVERQRREHKAVSEQIKRLNADLRKFRARVKLMKPGLEDVDALESMYPKKKVILWGRTEYI